MRINRYISDAGICSRREADRLIEEKKVTINGKVAELGSSVEPGDEVKVKGKLVKERKKDIYIALNKPVGITTTTDKRDKDNIIDFINHTERIYPIGRLDKNSEGLILLTNNGDIVNKILRSENHHEKEYIVKVNKPITNEFLEGMANGVKILGTVTNKCKISKISDNVFRIILTQGLNRQIRRMCEVFGYRVITLERIRILNIRLGKLKTGTWRNLTNRELHELFNLIGYKEKN